MPTRAYESTGHPQHAIEVESDPKEKVQRHSGKILTATIFLIVIALITVIVILSQDGYPKRSPGPAPAPGPAPKIIKNPPAKFGVIGLKNLGNTCYMNSVAQALVQIPQLEEVCKDILDIQGTKTSALAKGTCSYIAQYKKQVSANDSDIMIPQALYDAKCVDGPNGEQHDSSECVTSIIDALVEADGARVRPLFAGTQSQTVTRGGVAGDPTTETVTILPLAIQGISSLEESLRAYTAPEEIDMSDGYCFFEDVDGPMFPVNTPELCEEAGGQWEVELAERKATITAGAILVISLKRFDFTSNDDGTFVSKKINDAVTYPSELDLTEYAPNDAPDPAAQYELFAIVRHHGESMGSGHYTAVVKPPIPEPYSQWFIANDSLVEEHKSPLNHSKEAYLLFYKRK